MASSDPLLWVLTAWYAVLCVTSAFQVGRILWYRHNKLSFQLGFLSLAFLWTSLRAGYFAFVYPPEVYIPCFWNSLIFGIPIVVQFATFSLLVLFYAYWVHRSDWERMRNRFVIAVVCFNLTYLSLFLLWSGFDCTDQSSPLLGQLQAALTGGIFLSLTMILTVYGFRLYRLQNTGYNQFMVQRRASSTRQIVVITTVIVLIFTTRSLDDFLSVSPKFRRHFSHPMSLFDFACYTFWEITPTLMVLVFFRHIPKNKFRHAPTRYTHNVGGNIGNSQQLPPVGARSSKDMRPKPVAKGLFDDPSRYDAEDDRFLRSPSWSQIYGTSGGSTAGLHCPSGSEGGGLGSALLAQYGRSSHPSAEDLVGLVRTPHKQSPMDGPG